MGSGDCAENRLIPDLIHRFQSDLPIPIRNPLNTGSSQHVLDPLRGYLLALEAILDDADITAMNYGPNGDSLSVREVVEIVVTVWPIEVKVEFSGVLQGDSKEAVNLQLDSSLAKKLLH